jgi:hypothetical protein
MARRQSPVERSSTTQDATASRFFAALVMLLFGLLALSIGGRVEAYGVVAWTSAVRGTPIDPSAVPGPSAPQYGTNALAVDGVGNVYVTGKITSGFTSEFLTIKYNASGAVQWRAFAEGNEPGAFAAAIAVDAAGNVYVTGGAEQNDETGIHAVFLTIKYDQNGTEVWRALGISPGGGAADALALDAGGNVFVTGHVDAQTQFGRVSYLTIKYDNSGVEQWRATVPDAMGIETVQLNGLNRMVTLGLDANGNVYLGASTDTSGKIGYMALGYDAGGAERWRVLPKASPTSDDYLAAVAVDTAGNTYLTGASLDGNVYGAFTIKYASGGAEQWRILGTTPSEASNAISIDTSGNVYTAGTLPTPGANVAVVTKYAPSGALLWRTSSPCGALCEILPLTLALDAARNVYVAGAMFAGGGYDFSTIKYNATGAELWRATANGVAAGTDIAYALRVDGAGNVLVTGSSDKGGNTDWMTIKYNNVGTEQWRMNEGVVWTDAFLASGIDGFWSWQKSMVSDGQGNVYLTGYVGDPPLEGWQTDLITVKLDSNGNELWRRAAPTPNASEFGFALSLDAASNVYVTGASDVSGYLSLKYNTSGQEVWRTVSQAGPGTSDSPVGIAADSFGGAYVAGNSFDGVIDSYFTVKYDATGAEQWRRLARGQAPGGYYANAFGVDAAGNVYVSGDGGPQGQLDCLTVSYAADGTERWRATCNGAGLYASEINSLAVDVNGNVYVGGMAWDGIGYDILTIKYAPTGVEQWRALSGMGASYDSAGRALAVDALGNAYVVGIDVGSGYQFLTIKYDTNGVEQWRAVATGVSDYYANPAVVLDASGNVYITGPEGQGDRFLTVKYNTAGVQLWRTSYTAAGRNEGAYAIALAPGGVYVAGESTGPTAPPFMRVQRIVEGTLPSATAMASAPNPSAAGQAVTFTAIVTGYFPNGSVSFVDGGGSLPGCAGVVVNAGQAICAATLTTAGTHTIVAAYSGDNNNAPSKSTGLLQKVLPATTIAVTSSLNPAGPGQSVTLTATVTGNKPTGTVSFFDRGIFMICANVPLIAGRKDKSSAVTCTSTTLQLGSHAIVATYSGDANNAASLSPPLIETVNPPPPGVTLSSSLNPSKSGDNVTFTAQVAGALPAGTVTFKDGASTLCSAVILQGGGFTPTATCSTAALSAGSHSITATYSGDANNAAGVSTPLTQIVNSPSQGVALTSSLNPSKPGDSVTFTAVVTGKAPTGVVTFTDGGSALCSAVPLQGGGNTPAAACTTSVLAKGSHSITATYSGDANNVSSSSPVLTQTVKKQKT